MESTKALGLSQASIEKILLTVRESLQAEDSSGV
jgi:hypothetical protein